MTRDKGDPQPRNDQGPEPSHPQDTAPNVMAEALRCAQRGWPVFPVHSVVDDACTCPKGTDCDSPGKHPRTPKGVKDATIDTKTIASWWTRWPDSNVGIATGPVSGLIVLDIDPRHGGDNSLEALIHRHGPLPDTVEVMTGGGGLHVYFTDDGAAGIGNSVSKLGQGLDVRSDGGYVVGPGSIHVSGRRYEWEASSHPNEVALARPPQWIVDALTPTSGDPSQPDDVKSGGDRIDPAAVLAGVPEGERNDTLFRFVSRHRRHDLCREEATTLALAAGQACDPPLPDGETRRIVDNVYSRYESGPTPSYTLADEVVDSGTPQDRFFVHWGNAIEDLPTPEWLIDGIMTQGSFVVLYGPAGSGKTFFALDVAGAVATGQSWQGLDTAQGPVIYVAAEGVGDLGLRHEALRVGLGLGDLADIGYILEPVNLYADGEVDGLIEQLVDRKPALIVIDTLARSMDGGDENFAKDMNTVIKNVDRIRHATGATVIVVHHSGHDKNRERGSSALKGAADTFIKTSGNVTGTVTLSCEEMKTAKAFDDIAIRFQETAQSLTVVSGAVRPTLTTNEREGLTPVSTQPLTNKHWLEAFLDADYGSKSTFNRTLKTLKDKGYVEGGGGVASNEYTITDAGRAALGLTSVNEVSDEE